MPLLATKAPTYDERDRRVPHRNSRTHREVPILSGQYDDELAAGCLDIDYFARRWLGIVKGGHPGQVEWWQKATERADDGWRPRYLTTAVSSGNQAGKTLGMAVLAFHHTFYKLGQRPPRAGDAADSLAWARRSYEWYHLGIQQATANLVFQEIVRLLTGAHPAQEGQECPLLSTFGPVVQWDKKYDGEYPWIVIDPSFGGGQIHFRSTEDKAKRLLGKFMHGISFDEAAFELYLHDIYQEVLNLRRLATGGPLHFISTPTEGHNDYYDIWQSGNPDNPDRDPQVISLRMSTRDNVGYGLSEADFEAILRQQDEYLVPQNIDGQFIEGRTAYFSSRSVEAAFDASLPSEAAPERGHRYIQAVDPGIQSDATAVLTLDFTQKPWTGVRVRQSGGHQQLPAVVNMVREGHLLFTCVDEKQKSFCTTLVDSTALGGKLFKQEFSIIKPLRQFDFAGTKAKKLVLLSDLKAALDRGNLRLPRGGAWEKVRRQLLGYKLDDKNIEQDFVMALAMAVRHASRNPDAPLADPVFDFFQ